MPARRRGQCGHSSLGHSTPWSTTPASGRWDVDEIDESAAARHRHQPDRRLPRQTRTAGYYRRDVAASSTWPQLQASMEPAGCAYIAAKRRHRRSRWPSSLRRGPTINCVCPGVTHESAGEHHGDIRSCLSNMAARGIGTRTRRFARTLRQACAMQRISPTPWHSGVWKPVTSRPQSRG